MTTICATGEICTGLNRRRVHICTYPLREITDLHYVGALRVEHTAHQGKDRTCVTKNDCFGC